MAVYTKSLELGCNSLSSDDIDNVSLMSLSSDDQKTTVHVPVNTEGTPHQQLAPVEVLDHWASKCSRFADEFQTSRSNEEAQSNIMELEQCLSHYISLRECESPLRTDVLLYCVIANVIDGFQTNSHIYTREVPSVSKLLTQVFLTSYQLGRYGFQSFKQSVRAILFLKEYLSNRSLTYDKVPVILWQSIKKVTMSGTKLHPSLHLGQFHFHLDTCFDPDVENYKSLRIDFSATDCRPVVLQHFTTMDELLIGFKSLFPQTHNQSQGVLYLKSPQKTQKKLGDICLQQMLICQVEETCYSEKGLFEDIVQNQEKYSKAFKQMQSLQSSKKIGSVEVRFQSRYLNVVDGSSPEGNVFILGTKQYYSRHSQILLVDAESSDQLQWMVVDLNTKRIQLAERIENIRSFVWDLKFGSCEAGCWSHPEVHFVDTLDILPLDEQCSISFQSHDCPDGKLKCSDCKLREISSISIDQVFANGSVQINVKVDLKELGFYSENVSEPRDARKFAVFKFALSIPLALREQLTDLQNESKRRMNNQSFFNEEDFQEMQNWWEQHKDYYYAVWYAA